MYSDTLCIRANGLAKCFEIYARPRDRLKQFLMSGLRRWTGGPPVRYYEEFWALRGVDLEVRPGEVVGIIGRNGSGKSTLLQMICGTLTPTEGRVEVNGRVAALLELGAGFNPEYTGRENVYMNCALLGLQREEIDARFADIVAFSELEPFIEQPVKNYSSGMFARLAFAAAIHVDPQVLIVDEALSVGDFAFQYKCIKRLKEMAACGCTVLFVTHDIEQVQKLCTRALYLRKGKSIYFGDAREACDRYLADARVREPGDDAAHEGALTIEAPLQLGALQARWAAFAERVAPFRRGDREHGEILEVCVNGAHDKEPSITYEDPLLVQISFVLRRPMRNPVLAVYVTDQTGQMIIGTSSANQGLVLATVALEQVQEFSLSVRNGLREGQFALQVFLADVLPDGTTKYVDYLELAAPFRSVADGQPTRWAWYTPKMTTTLAALTQQP